MRRMSTRIGGLELTTRLSDALPGEVEITLIDKNEAFVFGFSKFDLMFGKNTLDGVRAYYRDIVKPGVEFRQELITGIDAAARRVTTDRGAYEADIVVIALGADYDIDATPGLREGGNEFYSIDGALKLRDVLPTFTSGAVIIGVMGEPFKCPPAPSEAAMLLDEYLSERGFRSKIDISIVFPFGRPIPPSPEGSKAILDRFAERNIKFIGDQVITGLDPARKVALLRDGTTMPYDLFLGVPIHRAPAVVHASGLAVDGWIPVDKVNLATRFPGVYAVGDVTSAPVPKAGVFAESAARTVAEDIVSKLRHGDAPAPFDGAGTCYVEFGGGRVGRVDADFLGGPSPTAPFRSPSPATAAEKKDFATSRRQRWFGYAVPK